MGFLNKLKPVACTKTMLVHQSDLLCEGNYQDILAFHSFQRKDKDNFKVIANILADHVNEGVALLMGYFKQIKEDNGKGLNQEDVELYLHDFIHSERNGSTSISWTRKS